jgi:hypothetical protein
MKRYGPVRIRLNQVKAQIVKAYTNGFSLRQIAYGHDTSAGSIRSLLIEAGVTMRKSGRLRKDKGRIKEG